MRFPSGIKGLASGNWLLGAAIVLIATASTANAEEMTGFQAKAFDVAVEVPADRWSIRWISHGKDKVAQGFDIWMPSDGKPPEVHENDGSYIKVGFWDRRNIAHFYFTAEQPKEGYTIDQYIEERMIKSHLERYVVNYEYREHGRQKSSSRQSSGELITNIKISLTVNNQDRNIRFSHFTRGGNWYWLYLYNEGKLASIDRSLKKVLSGLSRYSE